MRLPDHESRTFIAGATGSGKTRFGTWLFGKTFRPKHRPYTIIDTKREPLFAEIDRAIEIDVGEVPKHPGLYIMRPMQMDNALEPWFMKVLDRGNHGIYIDEGFMVPGLAPKYRGLNGILTQGRSKRIPVTLLSQRPSWVTQYALSEASYYAVFRLQHPSDNEKIAGFVPNNQLFDFSKSLPKYHCRWYDVAEDKGAIFTPCPLDDEILTLYDDALRKSVKSV